MCSPNVKSIWFWLAFLALAILLLAGFRSTALSQLHNSTSNKTSFMSSPYKRAPEKEVKVIVEKLRRIRIGDKWEKIYSILGAADMETPLMEKNGSKIKSFVREYFILKNEKNVSNVNDIFIYLSFDPSGQVLNGVYSNVKSYKRCEGFKEWFCKD